MSLSLTYDYLKETQEHVKNDFSDNLSLRINRAISWIGRAEKADDKDGKFIFLWIAFNAAYADESNFHTKEPMEWESFDSFFCKVVSLDSGERIYNAIWENFSGPIRLLMENKFVYWRFWKHQNGIKGHEKWEDCFKFEQKKFIQIASAPNKSDTKKALNFIFNRLNVLRNQLVHGGATWDSTVNRTQVRDGTAILEFLIPVFVDIMMNNPHGNWGNPFYPVISDNHPLSGKKSS